MNFLKPLLVAALATGFCVSAFAQQPVANPAELGFAPERVERITKAFQGWVDAGQIPGAVVLIARKDKIAYRNVVGFRDREAKAPMAADSIFRIASMTKPIVSVGAMMLAEEGKLDIAAPVAQYLPEFKEVKVRVEKVDASGNKEVAMVAPTKPMTVQDLLRHTAGLVYAAPFARGPVAELYQKEGILGRDVTLAETTAKIASLPLAYQPGEVWEYSAATDVLGRVIEVVSGVELDQYLYERVTKPLGMSATGFWVREADRGRLAEPQIVAATGKRPPMFDATQKPKFMSGGGGMVSTASDYLRFAEMLRHGGMLDNTRLLSPATIALMTSNALKPGIEYGPQIPNFSDNRPSPAMGQGFGLGFAVRTDAGENPLPGSIGSYYWNGAYGTTFYVDPKQELVLILMMQVPLPANGLYRKATRYLAYQAMTDLN
jgi:CubicO group peptidase (beta-lactamase class C family)